MVPPRSRYSCLVLACLYFSYLCQDLDPSFLGLVQRTVIFWFGATGGNLSRIFPFALLLAFPFDFFLAPDVFRAFRFCARASSVAARRSCSSRPFSWVDQLILPPFSWGRRSHGRRFVSAGAPSFPGVIGELGLGAPFTKSFASVSTKSSAPVESVMDSSSGTVGHARLGSGNLRT